MYLFLYVRLVVCVAPRALLPQFCLFLNLFHCEFIRPTLPYLLFRLLAVAFADVRRNQVGVMQILVQLMLVLSCWRLSAQGSSEGIGLLYLGFL